MTPQVADELSSRCASLWNLYGPTETAIWSTVARVAPKPNVISLGGPIANTRIYLLDRYGQPVPAGVPGELCIGGHGVARGYRKRPDLTAEKFLPDSFGGEAGARLYRTGDLARYGADGTLEFLGRIDHQIKIRGHRIELGEIESAILKHPAVAECLTVAQKDDSGDPRLVAYLVPKRDRVATAKGLYEFLKKKLPGPMIPAAFVFLDRLPRTPNGKVDRAALPSPEAGDRVRVKRFVAPRTDMEKSLAGILEDVLVLQGVGAHDNFFELGGHSLLATQVISRINTACRVELPVRCLFESPTIAELAREVNQRQLASPANRAAIRKRSRGQDADRLLGRIDQLSDEEVEALLAEETRAKPK